MYLKWIQGAHCLLLNLEKAYTNGYFYINDQQHCGGL
jgi:hypothetical protein